MTGARFLAFGVEALLPALSEGDVVVMDNLSAHKTRAVRAAFAEAGVGVLYLPRYSPEFNPIELCWAVVKACAKALAAVRIEQVERWVRHCGYRLTSMLP